MMSSLDPSRHSRPRSRKRAIACLTLGLALAPAPRLLAQEPDPRSVQPERPTIATHAHTVHAGYLEVESGFQRFHQGTGETEQDVPTLLKFGLASHLQFDVFGGITAVRRSTQTEVGATDLAAGLKWRMFDEAPLLGDFALQSTLKFPTGSVAAGLGTGTTDLNVMLISSRKIAGADLDVNLGIVARTGDGAVVPVHASFWTVSWGIPLTARLGWVAEIFGYPGTRGASGQRRSVGLLTGPTFTIQRYLVLDCGAILRVAGPQPRTAYAGLTWNIGRL